MTLDSLIAAFSGWVPFTHVGGNAGVNLGVNAGLSVIAARARDGNMGVGGPATLWRECSVAGVYIPSLMVVFVLCVALTWLLDQIIARLGAYRFIWHPPLFRVSLFTCVLTLAGLALYG
jgi:hypothetical protein